MSFWNWFNFGLAGESAAAYGEFITDPAAFPAIQTLIYSSISCIVCLVAYYAVFRGVLYLGIKMYQRVRLRKQNSK